MAAVLARSEKLKLSEDSLRLASATQIYKIQTLQEEKVEWMKKHSDEVSVYLSNGD